LKQKKGLVLWICGLPGSGKSTIAKIVLRKLAKEHSLQFAYLSMDEIRKMIFTEPTYDDRERDAAYRMIVLIASFLSKSGVSVLIDATAHRRVWRDLARRELGEKYLEAYVKCPIEICIERETKRENGNVRRRLYEDALERSKTGKEVSGLGKVPGVDEPFEESDAEIVVDSLKNSPEQAAGIIVDRASS